MIGRNLFPPEIVSDIPKITITGTELIHVEQHKGLMAYQDDGVTFRTALGALKIKGNRIHFKLYTSSEAVLSGEFEGVMLGGKD